jgi:hypothetical protein
MVIAIPTTILLRPQYQTKAIVLFGALSTNKNLDLTLNISIRLASSACFKNGTIYG